MRRAATILIFGLLLGAASFAGIYYFRTSSCRAIMSQPQPELAWLKKEFSLSDAEFVRISKLHQAYLPQCAARCRMIQAQNQKLKELLSQATHVTPEIQNLIAERAKTRAECEVEMMKHFLEVSRSMPPEQGRRYLAWVQAQTFLHGQGMEQRHRTEESTPAASDHAI
jgi:hypothetical protein